MALEKEDIQQLIAILQKGLVDNDSDNNNNNKTQTKSRKSNKKTDSKKHTKSTNNLFDKMSEASMHKDDVEIDKKLSRFPPTTRSRSYEPVEVRCRVCGRQEKVNPALIEAVDRYKCNKCARSAG